MTWSVAYDFIVRIQNHLQKFKTVSYREIDFSSDGLWTTLPELKDNIECHKPLHHHAIDTRVNIL